jgi:hypothetical protein
LISNRRLVHLLVIWIVILVLILAAILLVVHLRTQAGAQTLFSPRSPNPVIPLTQAYAATQQKAVSSLRGREVPPTLPGRSPRRRFEAPPGDQLMRASDRGRDQMCRGPIRAYPPREAHPLFDGEGHMPNC